VPAAQHPLAGSLGPEHGPSQAAVARAAPDKAASSKALDKLGRAARRLLIARTCVLALRRIGILAKILYSKVH